MEFDWLNVPFDLKKLPPKEIEESFEDPFSLKLLPEASSEQTNARYVSLGRSLAGTAIFSLFWTNGKVYRVVVARPMTTDEERFYERKNAEFYL